MGWLCQADEVLSKLRAMSRELSAMHAVILDDLAELRKTQASILFLLKPPGRLSLQIKGEVSVNVILFDLTLPPASAPDVVRRELTVTVAGASVIHELPPDTLNLAGLQGPQDASVKVSLVDIDDAGNRSPESVLEASLLDTFAPPKPGDIGLTVTGEIVVADEVPEPPIPDVPPVEPLPDVPPIA